MISLLLEVFIPALTLGTLAQGPIVSPDVHADHSVTFRFKDPGAKRVDLNLEGSDGVKMSRDPNGIWTYTTDPLTPDLYGYSFSADGETRLDPSNSLTKPNLIWSSNMVLVPGSPALPWEVQPVPHGTLHRHFYKSSAIGDERDFFVYTPAGYSPTKGPKLPVLYLLHGYSDTANGWTAVGQAHLILDNLIAAEKAKPMIVVMTLGYGVPDFASPRRNGFGNSAVVEQNYNLYQKALFEEVIPAVEREYRASSRRQDRAIAGLSMGGAETLWVGLNNLDRFSHIGAFSTGGLPNDLDKDFPNFDGKKANRSLKAFWISCGTEDGLIGVNRSIVSWLKGKGTKVELHEMPGRHAWMVWRRNLIDFSQTLFR